MHLDYPFAFPIRLRKLINFRWTKADSKPAEICNKSLKWKYNSTYNSGKMPFDVCRWAQIQLWVHGCWTTVNKETNSLAMRKYIKENTKEGKNPPQIYGQMSFAPAFYFYSLHRIFFSLTWHKKESQCILWPGELSLHIISLEAPTSARHRQRSGSCYVSETVMWDLEMVSAPDMKRLLQCWRRAVCEQLGCVCVWMCVCTQADTFLPFALSFMQQVMSHII